MIGCHSTNTPELPFQASITQDQSMRGFHFWTASIVINRDLTPLRFCVNDITSFHMKIQFPISSTAILHQFKTEADSADNPRP